MDIRSIINKLEQITEATLTLQSVQAVEKQAMDAAAAKKKAGGMGAFLTLDPRTAGNDALAALAAKNGLPGLMNSQGEFVIAQGDADFHSKPNSPRTAPPNRDDTLALQKAGLIPNNAQGPSGLVDFLSGGGAGKEFQASKGDSAKVNAQNVSNEFIKKRVTQLKQLTAKIRSKDGGQAGTPGQSGRPNSGASSNPTAGKPAQPKGWDKSGLTKESLRASLSKIVKEEFGYDLNEKVTIGTGPTVQQSIGNGMTITVGKFQNEVALMRKIMAELADIDDQEVIAALQDAQAALDELAGGTAGGAGASTAGGATPGNDKEKDRARMKELVAITKKPPVASDSDLEETAPSSLSESMSRIREKLLLIEAGVPAVRGGVPAPRPGGGQVIDVTPKPRPGPADDISDVPWRDIPSRPTPAQIAQKVGAATIPPAIGAAVVGSQGDNKSTDDGSYDRAEKARLDRQGNPTQAGREQPPRSQQSAGGADGPTGQALAKLGVTKQNRLDQAFVDNALGAGKYKAGTAASNLALLAHFKEKGGNKPGAGGTASGGTASGGTASGGTASGGTASKTNLTKFYADEMAEMEKLITKYANDPEMADDVKATQAQLDALKATAK